MTNRETFEWLAAQGLIDIRRGELFHRQPPQPPAGLSWDKVEGMMLGLAVGDALGITTEPMLPAARRQRHGEIRDYLPNRYVHLRPGEPARGYPSDDTQLAFWTLEQMIADGGLVPENVARRFTRDHIFGMGSSVRACLEELRTGREWYRCGQPSAGNGALMRIAPVVIPHLRAPSPDLWFDAALCAFITHNDSASIAACVAFVGMIWEALGMRSAPEPSWWVERYVSVAGELETGKAYTPRGGSFAGWKGPLWKFVSEKVPAAFARGLSVLEACGTWYSGAFLLETVPSVLYILMRHAGDMEEALVRAVNDTKDNDTISAIVGAVLGALHGKAAIPSRWVERLSGRTTDRDDGRAFALLEQARRLWAP